MLRFLRIIKLECLLAPKYPSNLVNLIYEFEKKSKKIKINIINMKTGRERTLTDLSLYKLEVYNTKLL